MPKTKKIRSRYYNPILQSVERSNKKCFEMTDLSTLNIPAQFLIKEDVSRNPEGQTAKLCSQFISDNRGLLHDFGVTVDSKYDGHKVYLSFNSSNRIGALPMLSPTSGKPDYGLVIKPRFDWSGLGPMLSVMGWKVVPTPLKLPLIPGTERKVPTWVLSSIILNRIQTLLEQLNRTFEFIESDLKAPKGTVNWNLYAIERIPSVKFLNIPCRYPDLRDNEELKSTIHFTLKKLLSSLESQRASGIFILQLLEQCMALIARVNKVVPNRPTTLNLFSWNNLPIQRDAFRKGLEAIEWTIDDRGLAGLGDLQGLPWIMPMETFFEAWLETIGSFLIRKIGGILKTGRKRETITPISWIPPFVGSQKYLLPDVIIEKENEIIILDAKYKEHWEEMNFNSWNNLEEEIRERHREDLLQILAYSSVTDKKTITSCLIYPCKNTTWDSMISRNRTFHKASLYAGQRKINLLLTAIPMKANFHAAIDALSYALQN